MLRISRASQLWAMRLVLTGLPWWSFCWTTEPTPMRLTVQAIVAFTMRPVMAERNSWSSLTYIGWFLSPTVSTDQGMCVAILFHMISFGGWPFFANLRYLLKVGANVNQPNAEGITPLAAATQNRQEATIEVLKAHGAQQPGFSFLVMFYFSTFLRDFWVCFFVFF